VRHSGKCAVLAGGNRPERLKWRTVKKKAPQPGECSEKCAECNGQGARGAPDFEKYCRGSTRPGYRLGSPRTQPAVGQSFPPERLGISLTRRLPTPPDRPSHHARPGPLSFFKHPSSPEQILDLQIASSA
jgi:hypothetical protein